MDEWMNEWREHPESSKEISSSKQSYHLLVWLDINALEGGGHAHLHADTHLYVGGKFCLDLMPSSKKLLGEYSKGCILLPGNSEDYSNKHHLKSPWEWFIPQKPKLLSVDTPAMAGVRCLNLTQQCSSGQTPVVHSCPGQGSSCACCCT